MYKCLQYRKIQDLNGNKLRGKNVIKKRTRKKGYLWIHSTKHGTSSVITAEERITDVAYTTWISKIEPVKLDFAEGKATLMVPGDFHRQTLIRGYMQLLNEAFASVFGEGIEICFTVPDEK